MWHIMFCFLVKTILHPGIGHMKGERGVGVPGGDLQRTRPTLAEDDVDVDVEQVVAGGVEATQLKVGDEQCFLLEGDDDEEDGSETE
jgi:hypothetical protein